MSFQPPPTETINEYYCKVDNKDIKKEVYNKQFLYLMGVAINQSCDRRGVDDGQPTANLVRYDIQASLL